MSIFDRIFQRGREGEDEETSSEPSREGEVDQESEDTLVWPEEETTPTHVEPGRQDPGPFPGEDAGEKAHPLDPPVATDGDSPAGEVTSPRGPSKARPPAESHRATSDAGAKRAPSSPAPPTPKPPPRAASSTGSAPRPSSRPGAPQAAKPAPSGSQPRQAPTPSPSSPKASPATKPAGARPASAPPSAPPAKPPPGAQKESGSPVKTKAAPRSREERKPRPEPPRPSAAATGEREPRSPNGRLKPDTGEIDDLISELESPDPAKGSTAQYASSDDDLMAVGALFEELAVDYMAQLRDVMLEVRYGRALTSWLGGCEPIVRSLRDMAENVGRSDLLGPLDALVAEMEKARGAGSTIDGAVKDALLRAYHPLVEAIPKAFALDPERDRREPIIVRSTLLQIDGVETLTIDKLQAAGVMTIHGLADADPKDLADAAGIALALAERVRDRFRTYVSEVGASIAAPSRSDELRVLASDLEAIERAHRDFEQAAKHWSREAKADKRRARKARAEALHRACVSLARLGDVELIVELDRLPHDKKIEAIAEYLLKQDSRQKHG